MENIYIRSIDKKISLEEFKNYIYKVGHAYRINDRYFQKCTYVHPTTFAPAVESMAILTNINGGTYQLNYNPKDHPLPSLDFVNKVLAGDIVEIDVEKYDQMVNTFKEMSHTLENIAKSL